MTLDILYDKEHRYYTIENVNDIEILPIRFSIDDRKNYITVFGKKVITTNFVSEQIKLKKENEDCGIQMQLGMTVMSNKTDLMMSWKLETESDILQMCNQIQLLIGLEQV